MDETVETIEARETTAREDWNTIQSMFPAKKAITRLSYANGMSSRLSRKRMKRMMSGVSATNLEKFLQSRDLERVKALRTFASVNHEQALAAFRLSTVINVSLPVILLTMINILTPSLLDEIRSISNLFTDAPLQTRIILPIMLILAFIATFGVLIYGLLSLGQAREIRHLIDLHAAERGVYFGLEDSEDLPVN